MFPEKAENNIYKNRIFNTTIYQSLPGPKVSSVPGSDLHLVRMKFHPRGWLTRG